MSFVDHHGRNETYTIGTARAAMSAESAVDKVMKPSLSVAVEQIGSVPERLGGRALLVAISGIDASGKGYLSRKLAQQLEERGSRVALINVDGWLRLPHERFSAEDPAVHFYDHAFRFEEMFERLVLPLRESRCVDLEMDFAEETATAYRRERYRFADVDVVLLEGIFLLKRAYRHHYDLSFWIECSYETALKRAIARAQEGLPPADTIRAYETIYFPAQRLHFGRDAPAQAASAVLDNDGPQLRD